MTQHKEKFWNFLSTLVFIGFVVLLGWGFDKNNIKIEDISVFDLFILMLASYRVTRMIVYDKVFKFFRDIFKARAHNGMMNSIRLIITCPWCSGVWVSLAIAAINFLVPYGNLFVIVIAISGAATFIQLSVNVIGLVAKEKEMKVRSMK